MAHPEKGALLIEVKGGRIRYDGPRRRWISIDRRGNAHDIDPFRQVVENKHALKRRETCREAARSGETSRAKGI